MTAGRPGSTAREERKLRKPLIERKRRERINHCLEQLKETVVGAFRLDQSKLEKADILEMTVQHLQNIQSSKVSAEEILDSEAHQRYSTGYIQCMHEVHNLLLSCDWMDKTLGSRLLNHLLKSLPRSAAECSRRSKPDHADRAHYHGTEADGQRSCPASPAVGMRASVTTKNDSTPPLSGPQPTEIPQLTALEMWRPW